jgi:hypothetical protein
MRRMHRMPFCRKVVPQRGVRLCASAAALPVWTLEPRRV